MKTEIEEVGSFFMNKILLKRLLFELLEEFVRLEAQIQSLEQSVQVNTLPYLRALGAHLEKAKEKLLNHQTLFLSCYQDLPLDETLVNHCFNTLFPEIREDIAPIRQTIYRFKKGDILPETELFINSLNLEKILPDVPKLIILPTENAEERETAITSESVLLEFLPFLALETPLYWMGLLESFSRHFCEKTVKIKSFLEEIQLPIPSDAFLAPLLNLRILGPCYYALYVLNGLKKADSEELRVVEPILFQELNRFGLVSKDLVILHQSLEKTKHVSSGEIPKTVTKILNSPEFSDEILKIIEKVIPERLAFTEKSFLKSQILEDRLSNGVLISAVPMLGNPSQLREDLKNLADQDAVYPLLHQLEEYPATPREIINAGWLYKLDQTSDMLYPFLETKSAEAWDQLKNNILDLDALLLKSIEISEVHRVLSYEELEHTVPV